MVRFDWLFICRVISVVMVVEEEIGEVGVVEGVAEEAEVVGVAVVV